MVSWITREDESLWGVVELIQNDRFFRRYNFLGKRDDIGLCTIPSRAGGPEHRPVIP